MTQDSSDFFLLFKDVAWMIVFICEAVLILTENVMTILIFWGMRKRLKRTSYLLINLAVADFFVGIGLSMFIGTDIARTLKRNIPDSLEITLIIIDLSATLSSVASLALISLERMFAILWPFRHRLLKTRNFYVSIGVVWLISVSNGVSTLSSRTGYNIFTAGSFIIAVTVIFAAYSAIWMQSKLRNINRVPSSREKSSNMRQNKRLANTLFVVTALSLMTCLPYGITIAFNDDFLENLYSFRVQFTLVVMYANSFLNPIVYCFRMPAFKASLKKIFCHCTCPGSRNRFAIEKSYQSSGNAASLKSIKTTIEIL